MFVKHPARLTKDELVDIVGRIQGILYLNVDTGEWDPDKEIMGSDCVELVADTLLAFDLVPRPPGRKDWRPPR